jgi:hypothetical protein
MSKEWTDEEVQAEISAAVAIVREDRFEKFIRARIGEPSGDGKPTKDEKTPPAPNDPPKNDPPKKRSLWWGDQAND